MNTRNLVWLVVIVGLASLDAAFGACQATCLGVNCDQHISRQPALTCKRLEVDGCDCSGCRCETDGNHVTNPNVGRASTQKFKFEWFMQPNYNCKPAAGFDKMLKIGEGGKGADDNYTVEQCKAKCAKHVRCEGFDYQHALSICRYKHNIDSDHLSPRQDTDCYIYERKHVVPLTVDAARTTRPLQTARCLQPVGCMGTSCDVQISKNPSLTCARLEANYCNCGGCDCLNRGTAPSRTTPLLRGSKRCRDVVCGGTSHCIDSRDGFECFCAKGWIGGGANRLCENVNECAGVVCGGDESHCVDGINLYECLCAEGYTGGGINILCKANVCKCANGVAGTGSGCPTNGAPKCVSCNHGFSLQMDDTCVDMCALLRCGAHGDCYAGKCYCKDKYTGSTCSDAPDACAATHCGIHGRCFDGDCFCEDFYTGKQCLTPPGAGGSGGVVVVHGRQ